jgi:tellurite methyltransferase
VTRNMSIPITPTQKCDNPVGQESRGMKQQSHLSREFEPSKLVRQFGPRIFAAAAGMPVLDVACGSGRNALFLAQLGCAVTCIDNDPSKLGHLNVLGSRSLTTQLQIREMDLTKDVWPFAESSVGGIVTVHFFLPCLFPLFGACLSPGGYLLFETPSGHGGNYRELPKSGEVRSALAELFHLELYRERRVGPPRCDAVVVQVLACRKSRT